MKQGILTKNVPDLDMSGQEIDEASFHRGRTVSLIRRMIAFCYDFLCAGLIAAVLPVLLSEGCAALHKTLFYKRISGTKILSTIRKEKS